MAVVKALQSFDHNGSRKRGTRFHVSDHVARRLQEAGLVVTVRNMGGEAVEPDPSKAAGVPSSVLPAAPALPQATASASKRGGKKRRRRKAEASSL